MTSVNPPDQYSAQHRAIALQAAAMACSASSLNPHELATFATHLCTYITDGTVPPKEGWL